MGRHNLSKKAIYQQRENVVIKGADSNPVNPFLYPGFGPNPMGKWS
jgi:hypothetical protein